MLDPLKTICPSYSGSGFLEIEIFNVVLRMKDVGSAITNEPQAEPVVLDKKQVWQLLAETKIGGGKPHVFVFL